MPADSGTPLEHKLGIKPGMKLAVLHAPAGYIERLELPEGARVVENLRGKPALVQLFVTHRQRLLHGLSGLVRSLANDGVLWICWPKGKEKSAIPTDLDDHQVRAECLASGLVDIKVCAIDEVWTGLKFVRRRAR